MRSALSVWLVVVLAAGGCRHGFDAVPMNDGALPRADDGLIDVPADVPADSTAAGAVFRVGTFAKAVGVAPMTQVVPHGLGTTPRALIMWSGGHDAGGFRPEIRFSLGYTDEDRTSRSLAIYSAGGITPLQSDRRMSDGAITFVSDGASTFADATVTAWDATSFTLTWNVLNGSAYHIGFLAIGGDQVRSRVLSWTMPGTAGPMTVSGTGFTPTVVLNAHVGAGFNVAPPANLNQAGLGVGAMTTGAQWSTYVFISDGAGNTNTQRGARADAALHAFDANEVEIRRAAFAGFDANGFSLNFGVVGAAGTQAFSLALAGLRANVGSFTKPLVLGTHSVILDQPRAVLMSSVQAGSGTAAAAHARYAFGGSDSVKHASVAFSDTDNVNTPIVDSYYSATETFVKIDNNARTIDASATLTQLTATAFTLNWTANDAVPTLLHFVALGE